jgi:hypothetical protein
MSRSLRRRYGYALRPIMLALGEHLETAGVLAARYHGKDISDRSALIHTVVVGVDGYIVRALCRRVPPEGLADDTGGMVTCPECIRRTPAVRFT